MSEFNILIAEDDENDYFFIETALKENYHTEVNLMRVVDGEELVDFMNKISESKQTEFLPDIIIVDISMPKKDGFSALKELKSHKDNKIIPIIIMSTSNRDEDVYLAYSLGANSFITKPDNLEKLQDVANALMKYWFEKVSLASHWIM